MAVTCAERTRLMADLATARMAQAESCVPGQGQGLDVVGDGVAVALVQSQDRGKMGRDGKPEEREEGGSARESARERERKGA